MKYLKAIWAFFRYIFVPQRRPLMVNDLQFETPKWHFKNEIN